MISIIHPSRGRPDKSYNTFQKWMSKSSQEIEFILSIDSDEPTNDLLGASKYITKYNGSGYNYKPICRNNKSAIEAINYGARVATGDIMIVVSDDTDCPDLWDLFLLKWIAGRTDFICKTNDGTQPWIITNPILDRTYYNRFGYIYHPDFRHMFADTFLTCQADLTGRKIVSNIMFRHNHYSVTKEQRDAVSIKADSTWAQGEETFIRLAKQNFCLKPEDIKGKITDPGYLRWMKSKGL